MGFFTRRATLLSVFVPVAVALAGCNQPASTPAPAAPAAPTVSPVERGKMLVMGGGCHDCHTPKKMGPNGPEADLDKSLVGPPGERGHPAAFQGRQGQPVPDPHQRPPDRLERRVGRVVCRQPDAGRDHRHRAVDRGARS